MSSQWISEENIYYNLEQGEMKLRTANLVDNIYRNNFKIDPPKNKPEKIIDGEPEIHYNNLVVRFLKKLHRVLPSQEALFMLVLIFTIQVQPVLPSSISIWMGRFMDLKLPQPFTITPVP